MKKLISVLIFMFILTIGITAQTPESAKKITMGQYIVFGKYNDAPILWRCIKGDDNGMLFFADKIITIKAYDGPHLDDKGMGDKSGSNSWSKSNIRAWLNSDAKEGEIVWGCDYPPKKYNSYDDNNYENEKGFLADGNFTKTERSIIKPVRQKSILNESELSLADGGSEIHYNQATLAGKDDTEGQYSAKSNFDKAYFQWVTDKMFLLDVEQIGRDGVALGAYPTEEAVKQSTYANSGLKSDKIWRYCLRTPIAKLDNIGNIRRVASGKVSNNMAADSTYGIRPAFYLDTEYAFIMSGDGNMYSPYVIDGIEPQIVLKKGNSPMAMIADEVEETDFKDKYMYNGLYYNPAAWGCGINPDLDETALFIRKGSSFRDPGFTAYDSKREIISSYSTSSSITVSVYKEGSISEVEDKTFILSEYFKDDYLFYQLRLWNIVPGIYSINYSTNCGNGKEITASRPLVVLSQVGDINYDGVTNSIDANYLSSLLSDKETLELEENTLAQRLYKYRICDVNKDNVVDKKDIDCIYMNMRNVISTYYKI